MQENSPHGGCLRGRGRSSRGQTDASEFLIGLVACLLAALGSEATCGWMNPPGEQNLPAEWAAVIETGD